jgi:hypothetical protein
MFHPPPSTHVHMYTCTLSNTHVKSRDIVSFVGLFVLLHMIHDDDDDDDDDVCTMCTVYDCART